MTQEVAVINVIYKKMGIFYSLVFTPEAPRYSARSYALPDAAGRKHEKGGEAICFPSFEVMRLSAT